MADRDELLEQLEEYDVPAEVIERFRSEMDSSSLRKKLGELEAWKREQGEPALQKLQRFETQPKRVEALKRVGIDYDSVPKYGQQVLDSIPTDRLDDLEHVAQFVKDQGFEANLQSEQEGAGEPSGAERIVDQATSAGSEAPPSGQAEANAAFEADLDKVPDDDKEGIKAVLAKHGRLQPSEG